MNQTWLFDGRLMLRALSPRELAERKSSAQEFELVEEFAFTSSLGCIVVPAGFISDFASVPRAARWYVDDDDPAILFGSVVHDWIYSRRGDVDRVARAMTYSSQDVIDLHRPLTRQEADQILREAMEACGARRGQRVVVYWAVRLGGGSHWKISKAA